MRLIQRALAHRAALPLVATLLLLVACASGSQGIGLSQKRAERIIAQAAPSIVFGAAPGTGEIFGVKVLSFGTGDDNAPMVFAFGEPRSLTALMVSRTFDAEHKDAAFAQVRAIASAIGDDLGGDAASWMTYQLERAAHEEQGSVQRVFARDIKIRVDWGLPDDPEKSNVALSLMVPSFPVYWDTEGEMR